VKKHQKQTQDGGKTIPAGIREFEAPIHASNVTIVDREAEKEAKSARKAKSDGAKKPAAKKPAEKKPAEKKTETKPGAKQPAVKATEKKAKPAESKKKDAKGN